MSKFVITYTPCFRKNMLKEVLNIDNQAKIYKVLSDSVLIIDSELPLTQFQEKMVLYSPIFIKHLMPIFDYGTITGDFNIDKKRILNKVLQIPFFSESKDFNVQCRIIKGGNNGLPYSSKDIEIFVGTYFENFGLNPIISDNRIINNDINIISCLISGNDFYVGISTSTLNLNFQCDEYRVCSKNGRVISRAENKLIEAFNKFNIKPNENGYALDIGAAPGGWTKVLVDYGYNVVAVDPGKLKPELENHPKIKRYQCRIENLSFKDYFDMIVDDMNVEPQTTALIMNGLSTSLKSNGMGVITLKLPNRVEEDIEESTNILKECYDVLAIKSLFHNRQEVTTLVRKKNI